jgi:hypothetical protein
VNIDKIKELENNGSKSPEQAEILRRNIILCSNKFVSTGAITQDIDQISPHNPRQLMAPELKMLKEASIIEKEQIDKNGTLSKEEEELLKKLLKKSKGETNAS